MASNKLEEVALAQRAALIPKNTYNGKDSNNNYSSTHKNAKSDGDIKGKGTGVFLDTANGGGEYDINGNPSIAGSGRKNNVVINKYKDGQGYQYPDMSGNIGQITL